MSHWNLKRAARLGYLQARGQAVSCARATGLDAVLLAMHTLPVSVG